MFGLGVVVELLFLRPLRAEDRSELSPARDLRGGAPARGHHERHLEHIGAKHQHQLRQQQLERGRLPDHAGAAVGVPAQPGGAGMLLLLLNRTRFGRAIRATVQNPESARLLGVESDRVSAIGFGLGAATAAAAGSIYGLLYPFNSGSHYDLISGLLSIVLLGGLGSIGGAVVGSLIVSTSSAVVAATISPSWSEMTFFVILLLVLLVRPQGLFGTRRGAPYEVAHVLRRTGARDRLLRPPGCRAGVGPGALDPEHPRLHADVRGDVERLEPGRRLRRLPVAGPRSVLRHRCLLR